MSNTTQLARPIDQNHPKTIKVIINRARSLVDSSIEPSATVRLMAKTIIDDFEDLVHETPKMNFKERVMMAKEMSSTPPGQSATWEHTCGAAMATSVLEMATKIQAHSMSYSKAITQLNRTIRYRERVHGQRTGESESQRQPKPSIPIDGGGRRSSSKSSRKQPYRRPNKAQRQRNAA